MGGVFLTGANGFLGCRLLAQLSAEAPTRIISLVRGNSGTPSAANLEFIRGDLLDPDKYSRALYGCETVIHLAAATGKHAPAEYFRVNRYGTELLVKEAVRAGVSRFLFVSTIAVKFRDRSGYYYAESKQQAEAVVEQSGLEWTIIRPTMIFGKKAPVLDGLTRLATLGMVPVFGDGCTLVQPIFVDDLADCLAKILQNCMYRREEVEIGGPDILSIENLLLRIRLAHGLGECPVVHIPARTFAACLSALEPLFRPLLPITTGQLALFTNAGTIDSDPWVTQQQKHMKRVDEILRLVANENHPA